MKKTTWIETTQEEVDRLRKLGFTYNGVVYLEELVSSNGMSFTLVKEKGITIEQLQECERTIRKSRDVVGPICYVELP